jgi:hypothetical protein
MINFKIRQSNLTDYYHGGSSLTVNKLNDQDVCLSDLDKFYQSMKKALFLLIVETKFIDKLFDKDKYLASKILERVFDHVLNYLTQEAEVDIIIIVIFNSKL